MKKVGIITLTGNYNFGNRLQCYALLKYCNSNFNMEFVQIKNYAYLNNRKFIFLKVVNHYIKVCKERILNKKSNAEKERTQKFLMFEKYISYYPKVINSYTNLNIFDFLIVGSDQIWNPICGGLRDVDTLKYVDDNKKISYSASFGLSSLDIKDKNIIKYNISKFKSISVREDQGKKMIEEVTNRRDVEVLIDPTMLLTSDEWDMVLEKPKKLKSKKYILNYFLGDITPDRKNEIERIAKENDCDIINILDKSDPLYASGPSEFLYLEKNAFLICTDSFHSSVFAIIYNRPFIIFDRTGGKSNMNSRIDTLISKFKLKNRKYNEINITKENLKWNYKEVYEILNKEREKSRLFLKKALEIEESE